MFSDFLPEDVVSILFRMFLSKTSLRIASSISLIFAMITFSGHHYGLPQESTVIIVTGTLALLTSIFEIVLIILIIKRYRIALWGTIAFFPFILILTITDEFGIADLIVLLIHLIPIVLLLIENNWFSRSTRISRIPSEKI